VAVVLLVVGSLPSVVYTVDATPVASTADRLTVTELVNHPAQLPPSPLQAMLVTGGVVSGPLFEMVTVIPPVDAALPAVSVAVALMVALPFATNVESQLQPKGEALEVHTTFPLTRNCT
jgi:hypothetical protein